jgi:hypothetical protein
MEQAGSDQFGSLVMHAEDTGLNQIYTNLGHQFAVAPESLMIVPRISACYFYFLSLHIITQLFQIVSMWF